MKNILATLIVLSTLALVGCSVEESKLKERKYLGDLTLGGVTCIEGYAFAVVRGVHSCGLAQIWENGPNGPRPMMCGGKEGGEH